MPRVGRFRRLLGVLVAAAWLGGPLLGAEASIPAYQAPKDYALEWARTLSLVGVAGAAALVAYVVLFRRRQIASAASQWLLFIGICVMPLPVMLLGSAVGLEQAKDISFCQHCHVMQPFVDDMRSASSDRLAAVHFKNRYIQRNHCYVCHTDYGLFGTLEAKLAGLAHIWRETTGSYRVPVQIARPYRFTICLDCHGGSAKFDAVRQHNGILPKIATGEAQCTSCHRTSHVARDQREVQP